MAIIRRHAATSTRGDAFIASCVDRLISATLWALKHDCGLSVCRGLFIKADAASPVPPMLQK